MSPTIDREHIILAKRPRRAKKSVPWLFPWEVYEKLSKIKHTKASGPDMIPPKLVKEFAYELSWPLTDILNCSFKEGIVPVQWKKAIVVPIPKQHPPTLNKLRPISLTSVFAKIAEDFISNWVINDIQLKIDIRQFGNVKGVSTSHYLTHLLHFLFQGAEVSRNVGTVVLTDLSKAFDLIDHNLLIKKTISLGVRGSIIPWICDFLHQRQQCVRYKKTLSDYVSLNGGVPQGTKLGPIGFQIMINDAANGALTNYWKYVDDLTFAENRKVSKQGSLQHDLDNFQSWCDDNFFKLNSAKCQALQVYFGKNRIVHTDLMIGSDPLNYVNKAKVLGIWLQNDLKWDTQVNTIVSKANRRLFILRSLKRFGFNCDELKIVYSGYVRPIMEYADSVWHAGLTVKQSNNIERIQKRACRIILGHNYISYDNALKSCELDTLFDRRVSHCHKFATGLTNLDRTRELIPPTRFECHGRNLRNSSKISQVQVRTKRFSNSPIPYFINLLNTTT